MTNPKSQINTKGRNSKLRSKNFCKLLFGTGCLFVILGMGFGISGFGQDLERAKTHYQLGQMYYELGLYKEAEAELKKALEFSTAGSNTTITDVRIQKQDARPSSEENTYIIDEGDILSVRVWENPDLNQEVIVRPDGKISFPLIDEVRAKGLTISALDQLMSERLKEYIRFPDVSISLVKMGGSKVILLGEVNSPGVYTISGKKSILEAIALAEGFTDDSVASSVILVRGGFSQPRAQRLNLNKALHDPQSKQNVVLEANDIVFVPKKFIADVNYVIRQIIQPFSSGLREARDFGR